MSNNLATLQAPGIRATDDIMLGTVVGFSRDRVLVELGDQPEALHVEQSCARPLTHEDVGGRSRCASSAEIAAASRGRWNPAREYEDDFAYVHFLIELGVRRNRAAAEVHSGRYAEILDGPPDARLELCRALLAHDAEGFDEALVRLLDERNERVRRLIDKGVIRDEPARWLAHVSVEGLALLAIAAREGLPTAPHYLHCPAIARAPSPYRYDPKAWRTLDYLPSPA